MVKQIVIVTYNGFKLLSNLLNDIKKFNVPNNEVCVVDNNSSNIDHLSFLKKLEKEDYKILYNLKGGFELSAYKYALDNLTADVWFLLQDSLRIKKDIFSEITPLLTDKNVYSLLTFNCGLWDNRDDITFMLMNFGTTKYSKAGWPSCYFASNSVFQKVKNDWLLPKTKIEAMAMERGVSIIFDKYDIEIKNIEGTYEPNKSGSDEYKYFQKFYGGRV